MCSNLCGAGNNTSSEDAPTTAGKPFKNRKGCGAPLILSDYLRCLDRVGAYESENALPRLRRASKHTPFFHIINTMVAIFLAKVRRAISGLMPLVNKAV